MGIKFYVRICRQKLLKSSSQKIIWPEKQTLEWKHPHTVNRFKFVKIMTSGVWFGKNGEGVDLEVSHRKI